MEPVGKQLVANFLKPALNLMDFYHAKHIVIAFKTSPQTLREGVAPELKPELIQGRIESDDVNLLVFVSSRERRIGREGVKFYRVYELQHGLHQVHENAQLQKALVEEEVAWDDDFDEK